MREVAVSGFVRATPTEVERALTPARIIEYEGSFRVTDVTEREHGWVVRASAKGLAVELQFERREDGFEYVQKDGPLEMLITVLTYEPENEGTRVRLRSQVRFGYPPAALTDRLAAWKRRGELKRALANLSADLE